MCGIAGIIGRGAASGDDRVALERMLGVLAHRGPDGTGLHVDGPALLGHTRLAIIDLETGQQPMQNEDGSIWIVFNGEIYNHLELRQDLSRHHHFRTRSDTEVILHLYEELGERCLDRLNGMFAFALWDSRQQRLFAARDRVGIKPFYWAVAGDALVFASEPKAILAHGGVAPAPDDAGLREYLTFQFCLGDRTLFRGISRLEPGHYLTFRPERDGAPAIVRYWDYNYEIDTHHTEDYFRETLEELLDDAMRLQLRSDVPVGAHCSGGIDSATVVSFAARHCSGRLATFTGAFREGPAFDETKYARVVAEAVGADYHDVWPTVTEFCDRMPWLIYMMDEPAAGPGLFPQYCVSALARQHVKVVLGGQGGDELFGGYARYVVAYLEQALKGAIFGVEGDARYVVTWESIAPSLPMLRQYGPLLQRFWQDGLFGSMAERYFRLVSRIDDASGMMTDDFWDRAAGDQVFQSFLRVFENPSTKSYFNRMTNFDLKTLLPALLHVEDRASMSVSLESRVPLLDHRIIDLVTRMPPTVRFKGGDPKRIFREAVRGAIPDEVFRRKDKMGFPVPLTSWLADGARDFVNDILLSTRARERGIYRRDAIERLVDTARPFDRQLWGLLSLELWFRAFMDGERMTPVRDARHVADVTS